MSLAKKTVHGVAWVTFTTIIIRIFDFAAQLALARLLDPTDFGLIAIGLLTINTMSIFRDMGFGTALIYKKEDSDHIAANTAFILLPLFATVLFAIVYLIAPFIASFFGNMTVTPIIQVLALTFVISSIGTVPSILLEKELEFKKKVIPETLPRLGYAIVAIIFAYYGYGVWSLVYGQITSAVLMILLIWVVSDWKPTFNFDKEAAKELFDYGKHVMGASIIIFLITNIDDAIVGRILGMEALGFYTLAYTISNLPATQITHLVGRVMLPTYSKLQDDKKALRNAYMKTLNYVSILSIPTSLGILVIAPDFVSVVLGDKWIPAVSALQILCIFGLLRSIAATFGPIFNATGNPKILRNISFLKLILLLILIFPLTNRYGIIGTALATTIPAFLTVSLQFLKVADIIDQKIYPMLANLLIILINSIIMMLAVSCTKKIVPIDSVYSFTLSILVGVVVYGSLTLFTNKEMIKEMRSMIKVN